MEEMKCVKCGKTKHISEFGYKGKSPKCKQCIRDRAKELKKKKEYEARCKEESDRRKAETKKRQAEYKLSEEYKNKQREYRSTDEYKKKAREYRQTEEYKEKAKQRSKRYELKNKDEIRKKYKDNYQKNKDKMKEKYLKNKDEIRKKYKDKQIQKLKRLQDEFILFVNDNPYYQNYKSNVYTYLVKSNGFYKIGISKDIYNRTQMLGRSIDILEVYIVPINIERRLHLEYKDYRFVHDDNFSGRTEVFNITDEQASKLIIKERFKKTTFDKF